MRRIAATRIVGAGLAITMVLSGCTSDDEPSADPPAGADEHAGGSGPLRVRLAAGEPISAAPAPTPVVAGDELGRDRLDAVLARLPDFATQDADRQDVNQPTRSLRPPTVGGTVDVAFPEPDDDPAAPTDPGPVEVLRHQPDGDVAVAPFLSVTFNQDMTELGTLEQLDRAEVPVRVTPELPGRWRWIGARTLRYEHVATEDGIDRLPAATEFTVEVPAGTSSVDGDELAEPFRWTFRTPPPTVASFVPTGASLRLEPVFVATFDQRVDPAAVLATVSLTADGDPRPLRLATPAEVDADDVARQAAAQALPGRAVAFRPGEPLPPDARIAVDVGPGTPSAEGPRTTDEAESFTGRTFGAFRVMRHECGHASSCRPGNPLVLTFSNPIDPAGFDRDAIRITPSLPDAAISAHGEQLVVQGSTAANTSYRVTVPGDLADRFGQTLGADASVTFDVGDPQPELRPFQHQVTTADPYASPPGVSVTSVAHRELRVRMLAVTPDDYPAYGDWLRRRGEDALEGLPGWPVVVDRTVDTGAGSDGLPVETVLDLRDAIDADSGHVVVIVESTEEHTRDTEDYWRNRPAVTWAQVTSLGVDAFADDQRLVTWVTDLADGTPVPGATVHVGSATTTTDRDGLATTALVAADHVVVGAGDDSAILSSPWSLGSGGHDAGDEIRWHVVDDRGLYRPGETLHLKGVVRRIRLRDAAKVVAVGGEPSVRFEVYDGVGVAVGQGTAALGAAGTFDLALDIPEGANLGSAWISLFLDGVPAPAHGTESGHHFRIDEFRRAAFEVVTRQESPGPHVVTEPATLAVAASYFAGGPLGAAPLTWTVTHRDTTYAPPNWTDFTFGVWVPWWFEPFGRGGSEGRHGVLSHDMGHDCCFPGPPTEEQVERFDATTDAGGEHYLEVDLEGERPDQPVNVSANAAVTDVDAQQLAGTVDLLVHPARNYVGLRSDRTFVREGESLDVDVVVTTIDGEVVTGRDVTVTAARLEERFEGGEHVEAEVDEQTCDATSADEPVACSFDADVAGRYRVTAVVGDGEGGRQRTELVRWVAGAGSVPSRTLQQEQATIVPDRETYAVGDTAHLLVMAPFDRGHGLATVTRGDIVSTDVFTVAEGSAVLDVPITDELLGGADVHVTIDGATERRRDDGTADPSLPARPAFADGSISLVVPPLTRTLTVTATPRDRAVEPGGSTTLDVSVEGPDGRPAAGAEVAVIVADEAVLSLVGRTLTDPAEIFHRALGSNLRVDHVRGTILLSRPGDLGGGEQRGDAAGGTGGGDGAAFAFGESTAVQADGPAPAGASADEDSVLREGGPRAAAADAAIALRSNFDPLALFAPTVVTGDDGRATVEVTVPDNLTRYRVTAIAVHGDDRFGASEADLTARLPLMVRPSAPRFLNFGDRFEFRVTVQNQTDAALEVDVVLQGANLGVEGAGADAGGRRVQVPADDRVEVRIPASADAAGTARFRVAAVSGDLADAAVGELPVYTPVTTEAFATYGVLDGGSATGAVSAHRVLAPEGVVPQFGGLEISTASTSLATLTDAVLYLESYPYDSADAHASRVLAIAALRDVLEAFGADGLGSRAEADATAQDDLDALVDLQNAGGGFGWWRRGERSEPYLSVHAAHALVAGRDAGYRVSGEAIERSLDYLRAIEKHASEDGSRATRDVTLAYALNVRDRAGDRDAARAQRLFAENDDLPLDALAWIWPVVDDPAVSAAIDGIVDDRVAETPGAVTFTTSFDEDAHLVLASDRRTDGLLLDALIRLEPESDLIPKVVTGLTGNQRKGHWRNLQENTFILLALQRYFEVYEQATPDLVARVWLGGDYVAEHAFAGRSIDGQRSVVPMADLVDGGDRDLVVQDDGTGRLYYRLGLSYAPDDLVLDARDEGFVVDRTYEAIDDEADVSRGEDGTWNLRAGANVRVRLTMVADSARTNMALVDHLPAGLEAVNPAFATAPVVREEDREDDRGNDATGVRTRWWGWPWFDHQNLRDDRAEAFSNALAAGTYEYTYIARATTPGTFAVPPAKAEELYTPEVFGRSASDRVVVR